MHAPSLGTRRAAPYVGLSLSSLYAVVREKGIDFERKPHGPIRFTLAALDAFNKRYQVAAIPRVRPRRPRRSAPKTTVAHIGIHRRFELARLEAERKA